MLTGGKCQVVFLQWGVAALLSRSFRWNRPFLLTQSGWIELLPVSGPPNFHPGNNCFQIVHNFS